MDELKKRIEALEKELAASKKELAAAQNELKTKEDLIEDMIREMDELAGQESQERQKLVEIKSGKQTYLLQVPSFHFEGQKCSAESFKKDRELAERLLAIEGQQILIAKP